MEKISKSYSKEYFPVVLLIEDIREILEIISSKNDKISIESEDYSFDSIDELVNHFGVQKPKSLVLKSQDPYSTIELNPLWTKIYLSGRSSEAAGIFYRLDALLTKRQRKPAFAYSYTFIWCMNIALPVLHYILKPHMEKFSFNFNIFPLFLPWLMWVLFVRLTCHSRIILKKRSETLSFFSNNADTLIIALISAIIGAIVTKLIDSL